MAGTAATDHHPDLARAIVFTPYGEPEPGPAYQVAAAAVRAEGKALLELCRRRLPEAPFVVFLDEEQTRVRGVLADLGLVQ